MDSKYKMNLKQALKQQTQLIKLFAAIARWQYSNNTILRILGKALAFALFSLLQDKYYRIIRLARHLPTTKRATSITLPHQFTRFLPQPLFIAFILDSESISSAYCENYLAVVNFPDNLQYKWAILLIELGRLDLAKICFFTADQSTRC